MNNSDSDDSQEENNGFRQQIRKLNKEIRKLTTENETLTKENKELYAKYKKYKNKSKLSLEESKIEPSSVVPKKSSAKKDKLSSKCNYDIVLNIDSLVTCNKEGWEVEYLDTEKINQCSKQEQISIGVIGRENTGKTWVINKISKENFASGFYESTKGLSLKYFQEKKEKVSVFLDSAGMNGGIFFFSPENIKKYMRFVEEKQVSNEEKKDTVQKKVFEKIKELMIND